MRKPGHREGVRRYQRYGQMMLDVGQTLETGGSIEVEVDLHTLELMRVFGHVSVKPDGVYELTAQGSAWLKNWCDEKLAAHNAT